MRKNEFAELLHNRLSGLPQSDINERVGFYVEIIEDRVEDGVSEEEAVSELGSVDEIVSQILSEIPLSKIARERVKSRKRMNAWEIVLLILGSPIWLSLGISAVSVAVSVYASVWSVIGSLWAVFGAVAGCLVAGIVSGIVCICTNNIFAGIALIGAGFICAGVSIFIFFGCKAATKSVVILTGKTVFAVKRCFVRKGEA